MSKKKRVLTLLSSILVVWLALFAYPTAFAQEGGEGENASESEIEGEGEREQVPTFRTFDGSGNNVANDTWGQAGTQLSRLANSAYADGKSEPPAGRPNAREISNAVSAQTDLVPNSLGASDLLWQWGQYLDHDLDLSPEPEHDEVKEPLPISVPTGDSTFDPFNTGTAEIGFNRSIFDAETGTTNPREHINVITAWIDASQVYGSDEERAAWKRSPTGNSVGGRLNTSAGNLLPIENSREGFFGAGDVRANEQIGLTSLHTLFMREHNRLAAHIAAAHPTYSDEQIYQRARALVGAQIQIIAYGQYHDVVLGPNALPEYSGYKSNVDPTISNEFSTAAYRFGHTMLPSTLLRLDSNGNEIANKHVSLRDAFFNPDPILEDDIDPILRGLASRRAQEVDTLVIDDVRNFLFANVPGSPGFDLAALNIQRGRDHGLPTYNVVRQALNLPAATSFADITSKPDLQTALATAYGNDISKVDLWVGGLAEDHVAGSLLGETFRKILIDQFTRLRDGDRFWHENVSWTSAGLESDPILFGDATGDHTTLSQVTLSDIIRWNTGITNIQENVFIAEPVPPSTDVTYVSSHTSGSIGGFTAADEDVLLYNEEDYTQSAYPWSLHLNLDYVGITNDIDALYVMSDTTVLISFESTVTVPGLGSVLPQDVVRFVPNNTGEETGGQFQWYLDGSDLGLDSSGENIDAIGTTPDGRLLISTSGSGSVPIENTGLNLSFTAQDLIALTPTHLGASTSGRWEMYFDGSDVALSSGSENLVGVWVDPQTGYVYLSTSSTFAVDGLSGQALDIFVCRPILLGDITSCADFWLYFDGSEQGLTTGSSINAFSLQLVEGSETPRLYLSTTGNPTVGQISFAREDIIGLDTRINRWRVYFDGSDVGVTNNLNAFSVLADSILMSFDTTVTLPGVGQVTEHDIVRFVPTRTGDTTAGHFEWYFDGSDVELSNGNNEDIDAIGLLPDGRLLISVVGTGTVTGVTSFPRADILTFTPTSLGETTSGTWAPYFHGSDVLLTSFDPENVAGVSVDPTLTGPSGLPVLYLTTWGNFTLSGGLTGQGSDIFTCTAHHLGDATLCSFNMFYDGSESGFPSGHAIDGISIGGELCVMCNKRPDRPEHIYVSPDRSGSIGGVTIADEDIVIYHQETSGWELLFDGDLLGVTGDVNALLVLEDQSVLLSFEALVTIPGLGDVTPQDIVRFVPTDSGSDTPGEFQWYFNGSDVELASSTENIDAIAQAPDGRLLVSVTGNGAVTGVPAFASQDILAFTFTSAPGEIITGNWEMYFEGMDVWLKNSSENIDALWVDPTINQTTGLPESIYLSTVGNFGVLGLNGDGADIIICKPYGLGYETLCLFELLYDGSEHGLTFIDGFSLDGQTTDYYFSTSSNSNLSVGQIAFDREDILLYDTRIEEWTLYFDGSDVGLAGNDVNAALVLTDSILISVEASVTLPGVGSVDPQDIIRFRPTSTGHTTAGTFEWYFDGQDVGLESSAENIDAIALAPNGDLLISIVGDAAVPGVPSYWDEDLLAFTPTQLGETTSGTWRFYFDGSDVNLHNSGNEDLWGAWVDAVSGEIYLNTLSSFSVTGLNGDGTDVFVCTLGAVGDITACAFDLYLDGSTVGLAGQSLDGISLKEEDENDLVCYSLAVTPDQPTAEGWVIVQQTPNCNGTKYRAGTIVTLEAKPMQNYSFVQWSGDSTASTKVIQITMDRDKSVEANFIRDGDDCYPLTSASAPANGGNVNATPATNCNGANGPGYALGTLVTLNAVANADYCFDHWTGDTSGTNHSSTITMDSAKSVTANFVSCHTLTTASNPEEGGTVTANPVSDDTGGKYENGTTVTLTANPNPGYGFDHWSGDATGSTNPTTVTMNGDKSVTAHFVPIPCYTLATSVDPSGTGTVNATPAPNCPTDNTKYMGNTVVMLAATGSSPYIFDKWSGDASGSSNPINVTMSSDKSVTAHFKDDVCEIYDVQISNVRDVSFTLSWLTNVATTGEVRYGTDPNNLNQTVYDVRGQATSDETHYVTIGNILGGTTYYFDVVSCGTTDNNGGNHYSVTTAPSLGVPASDTVFGKVFESDGTTPANGTIVYITLKDNDSSGSSGQATLLSAIVDNGFWATNLGNARLPDLSAYFQYAASGDQLMLEAKGGVDKCASLTVDTANDTPAADLVLAGCPDGEQIIDLLAGWNFIGLKVDASYTGPEVCNEVNSQGGNLAEIDRWHNGGWQGHVCGRPFNVFDLELAQGYFLKSNQASTWTIQGPRVSTPLPLPLQAGWNSISVPHTDGYTAKTLCDEIISQGVTALEIDGWINGGWLGHVCGRPFNNFDIEPGLAYFVKSSNAGTVTLPAVGLRAPQAEAEEGAQAAPEAAPVMAVENLQLSNLRDTSLTLSWTTEEATTGYVRFGQNVANRDELPLREQVAYDTRGANTNRTTHYVVLNHLQPQTTYDIQIISGAETAESVLQSITTAPTLESVPDSDTIYGQVFLPGAETPATGALVYLELQDADGEGTPEKAVLLSGIVDEDGYWHANLGNARTADLSGYFSYSASGDQVLVEAHAPEYKTASETIDTVHDAPVDLTLTVDPTAVEVSLYSVTQASPPWGGTFIALSLLFSVMGYGWYRRRT
ncbi:MAG: peroxidase family protein [Ardenticatenaceae bacterium]